MSRILVPASIAVAGAASVLMAVSGGGGGSNEAGAQQSERPRLVRLLSHASFERNAEGWRGIASATRRVSSRDMPHGRFALRAIRVSSRRADIRAAGPRFPAARGSFHRASIRVRAANRASRGTRVRLALVVHRTGGGASRRISSPLILTDRFRYLDVDTAGRVRGDRVSVEVIAPRAVRGSGFEVDAVSLTHSRTPSPARVLGAKAENARAQRRPYDPNGIINRPIPADASIHPRSGAIVADLRRNVASKGVNASVDGEVPPVYTASRNDRFYRVTIDGRTERFRVPRGAQPGTGADHPLVILDERHPDFGPKVELRVWRAEIDHEERRISGQGTGLFHYNNDGERLNPDGSPSVSVPFLGDGTGSGLSYTAGLVRGASFPGEIQHAIRVSWGCNDFTRGFRAPAVKSDQGNGRCDTSGTPASARVSMGMRLRLDPAVDCDARTVPRVAGPADHVRQTRFLRTVCRALQDYGMVILDGTADDGLLIYMENDSTANWRPIIGDTRFGSYGYILRDRTTPSDGLPRGTSTGIPWSRMQVIN
ncbi:MAG: hypothetical protein RIB67_10705 [Miltoncostaeaceae bacterium]